MKPVTTVSIYIGGSHPALDEARFRQDLRELLTDWLGAAGATALIAVDESKA